MLPKPPLLQGSEEQFRLLSVCSPIGIFLTDADGRCIYTNPRCCEITGLPLGGGVGFDWSYRVHSEDRNEVLETWLAAARAGREYSGQYRFVLPPGTIRWIHCRTAPLISEKGECLGHVGTVEDITQRKESEETIDHLRRRTELLLNSAGEGIYGLDVEGVTTFLNPAAARMLGYEVEELVSQPMHDIMHHSYADGTPYPMEECPIYLALKDGAVHRVTDEVFWKKDGTSFPVEYTSTPIYEEGQLTGAVVIFRDISERKRAEEEQKRLHEDLLKVNHELNDFAYIVSHDLKAPLRAISSLTSWLAADSANKLGPEGLEHLELLVARVKRMNALIDGVLQYSRVGRKRDARTLIDLNDVLADVIDHIAPPAHVTITMVHPLPKLAFDPTRIEQVFQNLLSNAIKFLDKPQGRITVDCVPDGAFWKFRVTDNGPGIPAQHQQRIFQIFQTLQSRDEFESTGIGLTIVKKIIESSGGTVGVSSIVGQGSTFWFTVPRAAVGDENHAQQEAHSPG